VGVLDGVSFEVGPGEVVALLGPSGVGKTTLLRAIAGLLTPASGRVELGGRCVVADGREEVPTERRRVGLVFQDYALFPQMSVADNVGFGLPPGAAHDRVDALLALTELSSLAQRRPQALSGGQQQRVALARALATDPAVLLLDEPFANVDPALRLTLGEGLRRIVERSGQAALLITHDRDEALGLADRVLVLVPGAQGGRIAQSDTPDVVYRQPASAVVAGLTGPTTFIPGTRDRAPTSDTVQTPLGRWPVQPGCPDGRQVVVRPHTLQLVADGEWPIRRVRASPPGFLVQVETPEGPVWVATPQRPSQDTVGLAPQHPVWMVP
jgi:ABC-type sulfate/molybdate transport systems ATPase subunit